MLNFKASIKGTAGHVWELKDLEQTPSSNFKYELMKANF